jgi:hypothetical protein
VFDLGQPINVQFPIASAQLSLANAWQSAAATGSYEVHGFAASGPTAALGDLTISNRLYGPTIRTATIEFPIDVTTFVKSRLAGGARYVGFSVRNVADAGFNSYSTLSERWWFGGSRLAVTIETWGPRLFEGARLGVEIPLFNPWGPRLSEAARLDVEIPLFTTWAPRLSEAARPDVETSANSTDQPAGTPRHPKAFPISEIVNAAMISRIAASMTEPGARSIQKQAFEMISRIAANEIERLGREEP